MNLYACMHSLWRDNDVGKVWGEGMRCVEGVNGWGNKGAYFPQ